MCAKDTAESEYNMDVYLDTSASPEIPKVYQSLKFIRSPREELTSVSGSSKKKHFSYNLPQQQTIISGNNWFKRLIDLFKKFELSKNFQ